MSIDMSHTVCWALPFLPSAQAASRFLDSSQLALVPNLFAISVNSNGESPDCLAPAGGTFAREEVVVSRQMCALKFLESCSGSALSDVSMNRALSTQREQSESIFAHEYILSVT